MPCKDSDWRETPAPWRYWAGGVVLVGIVLWNVHTRLVRLEHARVAEETLNRLVTQKLALPLLEQAAALQKSITPPPEYPKGRRTFWWSRNAPPTETSTPASPSRSSAASPAPR